MEDYILSSCLPFDADPFGLFAIDSQDGLHRQEYNATSPYIAPSGEASAESTSKYDHTYPPSQSCHSDLDDSIVHDVPMPASPNIDSSRHTYSQSPASSGCFSPTNSYAQSYSATALLRQSPNIDLISKVPASRFPFEDQRTDSSSLRSSLASSPFLSTASTTPSTSPPDSDYPVCCLYPGCNSKPFKRRADLDRHYKHRHAAEDQKASFNCDYPHCNRRENSFHRLDHFRDHLREFHKENIQKRGSMVEEKWLEETISSAQALLASLSRGAEKENLSRNCRRVNSTPLAGYVVDLGSHWIRLAI
ncbi:hypothetical protein E4U57_003008 [Claviceps arundinis]|uniref:C2H2-type domain-containing protein n=1 Tax=Claviceps arundinis TaxID=1623583 RepID=A0A9P7MS65_9HYPO|nr:hypothetical protein E4U56_001490 [Claviceps arundinis]KAG5966177.1 hypothetical protein E4U57_003008 [Claviceps arundinis]